MRRGPVLDGIPFLRAGREELAAEALARQEVGDEEGALVLLLADQDDWWTGPRADPAALRELVRRRDSLSLREAMALLSWGPVADYFAHRWSDPTFLAGLALVEAHAPAPESVFELACGIGHHLRAQRQRGARVTGADVVFAKLWVARHWVVPEATLLCLDAAQPWPELGRFDLVCCHDAFYFLEPKPAILQRLRALGGMLAISHVHNSDWPNLSAGRAMTAAEVASMFPGATIYDDAELTRALAEGRAPESRPAAALAGAEAFSLVEGAGPARPVRGLPHDGAALRRNPLYGSDGRLTWPSERYALEYGPRATFPATSAAPARAVLDAATEAPARRRELLDLPERW
ncbi:class I SAM-dependent methyltransferase [Sabulicella glaciei]|uniref:Class I SAM-dependent methyltransferase n=1 Tax=Sabulicella glaciei TaxID=2984948 RepID=A0ABT3NU69_9PROT|nr:class I SAM-dependent methyltransferase [Roseococcus sp. MDT2-1-1]MCW8085698.1 class I SAM-dependent methyltransferase [Roseococcus sp. MDT2-1-1]